MIHLGEAIFNCVEVIKMITSNRKETHPKELTLNRIGSGEKGLGLQVSRGAPHHPDGEIPAPYQP